MLGSSREGYAAKSQKTTVKCLTCGLTESFYSSISVKHFKLNHAGHEVVEELPGGLEVRDSPGVRRTPAPGNGKAEEHEVGTKLAKLKVELAAFPALSRPVFRIRGEKEDGTEAFVQVVVFEEGARIRDIVAKGQHMDKGFSEELFFWDPESVEYSEEVMHLLGIRSPLGEPISDTTPGVPVDDSTVRSTAEEISRTPPRKTPEPRDTVFPSSFAAPPLDNEAEMRPSEDFLADRVAETRPPPKAEPEPPRRPIPEPAQAPPEPLYERRLSPPAPPAAPQAEAAPVPAPMAAPEPKAEQPKESPRREPIPEPKKAPPVVAPKPRPKEPVKQAEKGASAVEEEHLLVSKSWYIQGGQDNKKEAARLSKVLSAFRWKVEPVYTLGVMLDDIVSIETSRNEISGTLIKRIEESGYMLSAVTSDQGKVVAWFKRAPEDEARGKGPHAGHSKRQVDAIDAASGSDEDPTGGTPGANPPPSHDP